MIPYGKQDISRQDIDSVLDVLQSDFLTQGPMVPRFENALSKYCGANYALALNSATSALHVACMALGLSEGDWLWTSPITFVASANAGMYCGAKVDFVDIDPETYNMSPDRLKQKLAEAEAKGLLPKVLIPVHMSGQSCDMKTIYKLCKSYGVSVIEDASHAIGGKYYGEPIGSCRYSDITVFSFHPVKIITTAEGGAALTNDPQLAEKIALLRSHGVTRDPAQMLEASHGPWYYQQVELGYNYRMTDLQAALGLSQLERLDQFIAIRHSIAGRYNSALPDLPVLLPHQQKYALSSYHLYIVRLRIEVLAKSRKEIFNDLRANGVGVNVHYIPVHLQPYYRKLGFNIGDFPEAEAYYSEAISLPMFTSLENKDQDKVIETLVKLL